MDKTKNLWRWVWIIIGIPILIAIILWPNKKEEPKPVVNTEDSVTTYTDTDYDISFTYPTSWGVPIVKPGNQTCPEEDTYRTVDTVNVFDREISFPEIKLAGSDSMIRSGVRIYELDPKNQNDCGDELFAKLASGELDGEALSSVRLTSADFTFAGYYNPEASRLNTEGREQFLLATFSQNPGNYLLMQPYMSFIPYFGSPELAELDGTFEGDMQKYLAEGQTALPIREYAKRFRLIAETLEIATE